MKRGELYRVYRGTKQDQKNYRVFVVVSRQILIDSKFSSVICAPVYSKHDGFLTQIQIGVDEGLKYPSAIYCDELVSIPKNLLTDYIGTLSYQKILELHSALLHIQTCYANSYLLLFKLLFLLY
jgi:mRNA interferase MazF